MGSYLSKITLNINGLNAPTKRQRLAEWIQKKAGVAIFISDKIDFEIKAMKRTKKDTTE